MLYSQQGLALTESFEGYSPVAYRDQGGTWTIGYGHTGPDVVEGLTCTPEQAQEWLEADIAFAERCVNKLVTQTMDQGVFDAFVDFAFNEGCGTFAKSGILAMYNKGDKVGACSALVLYQYAGGKQSAGLLRRRQAEQKEFQS